MTALAWAVRRIAAGLLSVSCVTSAAADEAVPFRTRNLSPLVSMFGVPAWDPAERGTGIGLTSEIANHYRLSQRGGETLILDGETWRNGLWMRRGVGERFTIGIEIPYYRQSGGILDDVIDAWHSAFDMPDGARNRRPEDQVAFLLANDDGPFFALGHSDRGIGDVLLSAGRTVGRDGGGLLQATLKLPTGDEALLAGSGSTDFAVTFLRIRGTAFRGRPASFFWGAGVVAIGEPEEVRFDARRGALLGMLGGGWKPWARTGLKVQLDLHSAFYDSPLEEIGDPGVQITLGGFRDLGEHGVVELGVNEDLAVSTSPDLVLHATFRWTFSR